MWIRKKFGLIKETGLVVRQSSGYFVGDETTTNERCYHDYTYEFGTVTDKDVAKPDLTGYKIQKRLRRVQKKKEKTYEKPKEN